MGHAQCQDEKNGEKYRTHRKVHIYRIIDMLGWSDVLRPFRDDDLTLKV